MIREVFPDELQKRRDHFMNEFRRATDYSKGLHSAESMFEAVKAKTAVLFETTDGIALIDGWTSEMGLLVRIAALVGDNVLEWIAEVEEAALIIAKKVGAKGITSALHPDLEEAMTTRGYSVTHTVVFKALCRSQASELPNEDEGEPVRIDSSGNMRGYLVTANKNLH